MRYLEAAPDIKNLLEINLTQCSREEMLDIKSFVDPEESFTDIYGQGFGYPVYDATGEGDYESHGCTFFMLRDVEDWSDESVKDGIERKEIGGYRLIGGTWTDINAGDADLDPCWRYLGGRVASEGERLMVLQGDMRMYSPYGQISYEGNPLLPGMLSVPTVNLMAQDYLADVGFEPGPQNNTAIPTPPSSRENDWINVSRIGGEEINTMDGFTGVSQQVIRVTPLSADRARVSYMANYVHERINNIVGQYPLQGELRDPRSGELRTMTLDFQCCLLDEEFDQNDEEATIFGKDQFYLVVVSPGAVA